jgi:hypothetical protein
MLHLYSRASVKLALVFITLMTAATANAILLDCTTSLGAALLPASECNPAELAVNKMPDYALKDVIPALPLNTSFAAFQVDQTRSAALANSGPLLILIGAFLAFLLGRAKRFNTK